MERKTESEERKESLTSESSDYSDLIQNINTSLSGKSPNDLVKKPLKDAALVQSFLKELPEGISMDAVVAELAKVDPYIWTMLYRRIKRKRTTFNMQKQIDEAIRKGNKPDIHLLRRHRPFLIQPLRDPSQKKTYRKSRQSGVSETELSEIVWFLDVHEQTKALISFPGSELKCADFSTTRLDPMLDETPYLRSLIRQPNKTFTKRIKDSFLFLVSASETGGQGRGESRDIDMYVCDERDRMPSEKITLAFEESLSSSAYGRRIDISTPTIRGRGVDLSFSLSDQKHWFVSCMKCGMKQTLEYPYSIIQVKDYPLGVNIPEDAYRYACKKPSCRGPVNRVEGEWVAKYTDQRLWSGYQISQLMCLWISASEIMRKKEHYPVITSFYNYVLGETYESAEDFISDSLLYSCCSEYPFPIAKRTSDWEKITVGIDWGKKNWVVVLGKSRVNKLHYLLDCFWTQDEERTLESTRSIVQRIAPFKPDYIVADAGYGRDRNSLLREVFGDIVWACGYDTSSVKEQKRFDPQWSKYTGKILADRVTTLKSMARFIQRNEIGFPSPDNHIMVQTLFRHLLNLAPTVTDDGEGTVYEQILNKGADHLAHALGYALLGMQKEEERSSFSFQFCDTYNY